MSIAFCKKFGSTFLSEFLQKLLDYELQVYK